MKSFHRCASSDISALRILILDNAKTKRCALANQLRHLGIPLVMQAKSCTSALAILTAGLPFDIVFCDLGMKGMDGVEFIYQAAQAKVGGFILTAMPDAHLLVSAGLIAQGGGAEMVGVITEEMAHSGLITLLASYLRTRARVAENDAAPISCQWQRDDLVAAFNGDQFIPYFQPKIDLHTGRATCVEVLARWDHPDLGVLLPNQFIDVMEQEGLIDQLTGCLLLQALACAKTCAERGQTIGFAINVSPLTLEDERTPSRICSLVKACGVSLDQMTIEVTETVSPRSLSKVLESLTRLRMQGLEISVDDFGMGYSSMQLLNKMPFTELKIDRAFVTDASNNAKSTAILESIIQLAEIGRASCRERV